MKLIRQSATIVDSQGSLKDIERAARICYKSENKITEDDSSATKLVNSLILRGHFAMLEFGKDVYLKLNKGFFMGFMNMYVHYPAFKALDIVIDNKGFFIIRMNPRVIHELEFPTTSNLFIEEDIPVHMLSATAHIITNRGVSHELVRHRHCSFAQESTRYVDYKEQMSFINPVWKDNSTLDDWTSMSGFEAELWHSEACYTRMRDKFNWTKQQAREVLPNALKTELMMKATLQEWKHIFDLRCAKEAHPQMQDLMISLREQFKKKYPQFKWGNE